jgi:hypothetical protein
VFVCQYPPWEATLPPLDCCVIRRSGACECDDANRPLLEGGPPPPAPAPALEARPPRLAPPPPAASRSQLVARLLSAASMDAVSGRPGISPRFVALQVAFERQTLKPVFHLIGHRLWV